MREIEPNQWAKIVSNENKITAVFYYSLSCDACAKLRGTLQTLIPMYNTNIEWYQMESSKAAPFIYQYAQGMPMIIFYHNGYVLESPKPLISYNPDSYKAIWVGTASYIQYFVDFLDKVKALK